MDKNKAVLTHSLSIRYVGCVNRAHVSRQRADYETIGRVDWVISPKHQFFGRYFIDQYALNASYQQGISPQLIGSQVFSQDPNFLGLGISNYFSTYCGTCNHAYFNTNTWSYTDDLTIVRGRHRIMVGADVSRTQMNAGALLLAFESVRFY